MSPREAANSLLSTELVCLEIQDRMYLCLRTYHWERVVCRCGSENPTGSGVENSSSQHRDPPQEAQVLDSMAG